MSSRNEHRVVIAAFRSIDLTPGYQKRGVHQFLYIVIGKPETHSGSFLGKACAVRRTNLEERVKSFPTFPLSKQPDPFLASEVDSTMHQATKMERISY